MSALTDEIWELGTRRFAPCQSRDFAKLLVLADWHRAHGMGVALLETMPPEKATEYVALIEKPTCSTKRTR